MIFISMKIALIYRGNYIRKKRRFTFFNIIDNHKSMLIKHLPNCDLFFSTTPNNTEADEKLLQLLDWKKTNFTTNNTCVYDSVASSLNFYDFSEYDIIVNVRFDLRFNKPLSEFNIDYEKFNFLWLEPTNFNQNGNTRVCDLMYVFPIKYMTNFKNIDLEDSEVRYTRNRIIGLPDQTHHLLQFLHLDKETEVNFVIPGHHPSGAERPDSVAESFIKIARGR